MIVGTNLFDVLTQESGPPPGFFQREHTPQVLGSPARMANLQPQDSDRDRVFRIVPDPYLSLTGEVPDFTGDRVGAQRYADCLNLVSAAHSSVLAGGEAYPRFCVTSTRARRPERRIIAQEFAVVAVLVSVISPRGTRVDTGRLEVGTKKAAARLSTAVTRHPRWSSKVVTAGNIADIAEIRRRHLAAVAGETSRG